MTSSNSLKTVALMTVTAAATSLLLQACGGGDALAQSASDADPVEGVWESTLTVKDCTSGAVLATFKGQSVLHRVGVAGRLRQRITATTGLEQQRGGGCSDGHQGNSFQ